jgi:hypothetical protein
LNSSFNRSSAARFPSIAGTLVSLFQRKDNTFSAASRPRSAGTLVRWFPLRSNRVSAARFPSDAGKGSMSEEHTKPPASVTP